jgi:hypothetical protein
LPEISIFGLAASYSMLRNKSEEDCNSVRLLKCSTSLGKHSFSVSVCETV